MDQYPLTEEEEFELMYGEELNNDNEFDDEECQNPVPASQIIALSQKSNNNITFGSPQLSQITHAPSALVNRKLFGTPLPTGTRFHSTPMPGTSHQPPLDPLVEIQNIGTSNNRKRRLNDLFGDIHDIEEEEIQNCFYDNQPKKLKNDKDKCDKYMIDQILNARKQHQEIVNPNQKCKLEQIEALHRFKMQNLSYQIPKWPFITIVRSDMDRVYVRMHSEEYEKLQLDEISISKVGAGSLLGKEKQRVWDEAREITLKRLTAADNPKPNISNIVEPCITEDLWVEKYKPKRYIDLLSDETTNRSLLHWLKMWDKIVFNKNTTIPDQGKGPPNSFNKRTGRFELNGGWRRKTKNCLNTEFDEFGRPMQKVALLCGPPGLGKTTLAHTIAKHAGYRVMELNASDDRSPEAFRLALENGTQMRSVLNIDNRPNCIILDEIDGAPQASIDFLIKFINGAVTQSTAKKANKAKKIVLHRPIICICNNLYVPALRQLRQIAFVVNFPKINSSRLAERLQTIATKQNIQTDLISLLALADKTGNDVRSCISVLQFYNSIKKPLTLHDVMKSNIGQKDRHKGLFGVWSAVFQIQRPKRKIDEADSKNTMVSMTDMSVTTRFKTILDIVHMEGDYERLIQGVYENYLHQKMPDPNLYGVCEAMEWFTFSDRVQHIINQQQNYSVYPYLQFGFVAWHLLFATMAWPKINFPNKGFEYYQKTVTQKMIMTSIRKSVNPIARGVGDGLCFILNTVTFIRHILNPSLRSVSLQLLTPKERTDLRHAVEIMADLGIGYTQVKTADGTYQYQMEPNLDLVCFFEELGNQNLSYWSKQLIGREVELEQVRRATPKLRNPDNLTKNPITKISTSKIGINDDKLPNHLRKLQPKIITQPVKKIVKDIVMKDFFGRIVEKDGSNNGTTGSAIGQSCNSGNDAIVKSPIWFRYKEGFNNAVRKDVHLVDLL